jgi:hypothetical protein
MFDWSNVCGKQLQLLNHAVSSSRCLLQRITTGMWYGRAAVLPAGNAALHACMCVTDQRCYDS